MSHNAITRTESLKDTKGGKSSKGSLLDRLRRRMTGNRGRYDLEQISTFRDDVSDHDIDVADRSIRSSWAVDENIADELNRQIHAEFSERKNSDTVQLRNDAVQLRKESKKSKKDSLKTETMNNEGCQITPKKRSGFFNKLKSKRNNSVKTELRRSQNGSHKEQVVIIGNRPYIKSQIETETSNNNTDTRPDSVIMDTNESVIDENIKRPSDNFLKRISVVEPDISAVSCCPIYLSNANMENSYVIDDDNAIDLDDDSPRKSRIGGVSVDDELLMDVIDDIDPYATCQSVDITPQKVPTQTTAPKTYQYVKRMTSDESGYETLEKVQQEMLELDMQTVVDDIMVMDGRRDLLTANDKTKLSREQKNSETSDFGSSCSESGVYTNSELEQECKFTTLENEDVCIVSRIGKSVTGKEDVIVEEVIYANHTVPQRKREQLGSCSSDCDYDNIPDDGDVKVDSVNEHDMVVNRVLGSYASALSVNTPPPPLPARNYSTHDVENMNRSSRRSRCNELNYIEAIVDRSGTLLTDAHLSKDDAVDGSGGGSRTSNPVTKYTVIDFQNADSNGSDFGTKNSAFDSKNSFGSKNNVDDKTNDLLDSGDDGYSLMNVKLMDSGVSLGEFGDDSHDNDCFVDGDFNSKVKKSRKVDDIVIGGVDDVEKEIVLSPTYYCVKDALSPSESDDVVYTCVLDDNRINNMNNSYVEDCHGTCIELSDLSLDNIGKSCEDIADNLTENENLTSDSDSHSDKYMYSIPNIPSSINFDNATNFTDTKRDKYSYSTPHVPESALINAMDTNRKSDKYTYSIPNVPRNTDSDSNQGKYTYSTPNVSRFMDNVNSSQISTKVDETNKTILPETESKYTNHISNRISSPNYENTSRVEPFEEPIHCSLKEILNSIQNLESDGNYQFYENLTDNSDKHSRYENYHVENNTRENSREIDDEIVEINRNEPECVCNTEPIHMSIAELQIISTATTHCVHCSHDDDDEGRETGAAVRECTPECASESADISIEDHCKDTDEVYHVYRDGMKQLKDCGWYWGPLSIAEAEMKLGNKPDGTFLVRDSHNENYILSLSFKSEGRIYHMRIEHNKEMKLGNKPDGTFLVRDSHNENYILSLSFKSEGRIYHMRIEHNKEMKLGNKPDGTFLVRDSHNENYILSLSFKSEGRIYHMRIEHNKGNFAFWSQPESHGRSTIKEFIDQVMENSRTEHFRYFHRAKLPGTPPVPIYLLYPVSRFLQISSLQHLCRFSILENVRRDHINELPVPSKVHDYLKQAQYYVENIDGDDDDVIMATSF